MKKVSNFDTRPHMVIPQVQQRQAESAPEPNMGAAALIAIWQSISRKWIAITFVVIGIICGLIYGWLINPVEWTGGTYQHLTIEDKALLIQVATDLNVYDATNPALAELQRRWPEIDELACFVAAHGNVNESEKIELVYLAKQVNQQGCN
jgi:hypothetical protein